jgi:hypothetical protein
MPRDAGLDRQDFFSAQSHLWKIARRALGFKPAAAG